MRCPACGSEERDGSLYCGMCKHVFGKAPPPAAAPLPPDDGWIRRDGAKGTLDVATHTAIRALCEPARAAAKAGRVDVAHKAYEQALAKLPGNALLWDAGSIINGALGENYLRIGRYVENTWVEIAL